MKSIELLVNEHKNIKRMLAVVKEISYRIYKHEAVALDDFDLMIDFIRNYADKHHHEKEENILFDEMGKELGEAIVDGPLLAMFSEHDLGRMYISNLEEAVNDVKDGEERRKIDIITNARAYADLLDRHIDKEDNTIYVFGENKLSQESLNFVENEMMKVESEAKIKNIQNKYLELLEKLEEKYL
ncbi:MAG TPA: hemerythrin domain-containing protein [Clostridia bacterium]|nr:hemerythrin domain-containing protein [Clostridia bacterium]